MEKQIYTHLESCLSIHPPLSKISYLYLHLVQLHATLLPIEEKDDFNHEFCQLLPDSPIPDNMILPLDDSLLNSCQSNSLSTNHLSYVLPSYSQPTVLLALPCLLLTKVIPRSHCT